MCDARVYLVPLDTTDDVCGACARLEPGDDNLTTIGVDKIVSHDIAWFVVTALEDLVWSKFSHKLEQCVFLENNDCINRFDRDRDSHS